MYIQTEILGQLEKAEDQNLPDDERRKAAEEAVRLADNTKGLYNKVYGYIIGRVITQQDKWGLQGNVRR